MDSSKGYFAVAVLVVFLYNLFVKSTIRGMIDKAMEQMGSFANKCIEQMNKASDEATKAIRDANKDNSINMSVLIDKVGDEMKTIKDTVARNNELLVELLASQRNEPRGGPRGSGYYNG